MLEIQPHLALGLVMSPNLISFVILQFMSQFLLCSTLVYVIPLLKNITLKISVAYACPANQLDIENDQPHRKSTDQWFYEFVTEHENMKSREQWEKVIN